MRPGRELDTMIAQHIFNHEVVIKRKIPTEVTPAGDRPLREYSKEIGAAFDVARKLNISLIPIEGGQWFALRGNAEGFSSPAQFIQYLSAGNFVEAGAAITESAPLSICLAAMKSFQAKMNSEIKDTLHS
jgi:Phage ABA sandwich domain